MPVNQRGLYRKFEWAHRDGSPIDPDARYFMLRPGNDPHAAAAVLAYAESVSDDNPALASDLNEWIEQLDAGLEENIAYDSVGAA